MKSSTYMIRIPEPCHEDWNTMLPDAKGKFCQSCQKSVYDFTGKTDAEIHDVMMAHQGQSVCGRLKTTQVNRPMNFKVNLSALPRNLSMSRAFIVAVFLVFGTFLFSCTDDKGNKVETIEVVNDKPQEYSDMKLYKVPETPLKPDWQVRDTTYAVLEPQLIGCGITSVSGGLRYIEIPADTTVYELGETTVEVPFEKNDQPMIDNVIVGAMVSYIKPEENILPDSTKTESVMETAETKKSAFIKKESFVVFPNPANTEFTVSYDLKKKAMIQLELLDINGSLVRTISAAQVQHNGNYKIPVSVSELANGIYFCRLIISEQEVKVQRVVVAR